MEKRKQSERAPVQGHSVLKKYFLVFTRCLRSVFLYLYGVLEGKGHGVLLVRSLRCLPHLLFTFLRLGFFRRVLTRFAARFFA